MFSPTQHRLIVRPDAPAEIQTVSGIIITPEAQETKTGIVVAVGPGHYTDAGVYPCWVRNAFESIDYSDLREIRVGDRVYWNSRFGAEVVFHGEGLVVLADGDVLIVEWNDNGGEQKSVSETAGMRQSEDTNAGEIPAASTN